MDDINDFFSISPNFKRETLPSGYDAGRFVPKLETNAFPKRETQGTEYAEDIRNAEMEQLAKLEEYDSVPLSLKQSTYDDIDDDDDDGSKEAKPVDSVYSKYDFNRILPDLPIVNIKDQILDAIDKNPVTVLEGATGSGKSTQVPQFILDDAYQRNRSVNIIVTQPRRLAAVSVASRVSMERGLDKLPNIIGFQIGLKVSTCDDTRITFCTTGVLLEKLIAMKTFCNYTHIILDEVHERSQDMDFLFIVIKKLRITAPNVRIILMSATIEAKKFASYFQHFRNGKISPAPIIKVESQNRYRITQFFWNDLSKINIDRNRTFNIADPKIEDEMYSAAVKLIFVADRIDRSDNLPALMMPSILIFLPGIYEINCMNKHFEESTRVLQCESNFIILILHSLITHEEQAKAMRKPTPGKRLIILATNIAESSITVPDVKYVIDFCLTKTLVTDTTTNFSSLQLEWCSRSNCRQRAGRTGRTMDGRVYHLVPKLFYEHQMEETSRPEMCRSPLEMVVLKAKQLDIGPPVNIISLAMDVPTLTDVKNTILLLKEVGALLSTCDGVHADDDGDITFIGVVMSALPVNIRVAKLIILGYCFSVLEECIIMGAGLTTKTIFVQGYKNAVTFYSKKLVWSDGSGSDLFAILKAYKSYQGRKQEFLEVKNWTERYFLNEKSLIEMSLLISEITERLMRLGVKERTGVNRATWSHAEKSIILKCVIAGAFYPNFFVRLSDEMEDRSTCRVLSGRNPCNTVYFTGFEEKYIRPLYIQSIKKKLMCCTNSPDNMQVTFDEGNEKVFVTFKQTKSSVAANNDPQLNCIEMGPGQVCIEVYKAVKLRRTTASIPLKVMHPRDANKYAEKENIGSLVKGKWQSNKKKIKNIEMVCLPRLHIRQVTGVITHVRSQLSIVRRK